MNIYENGLHLRNKPNKAFKDDTSDDKCHCHDWSLYRDQNANILCLGVNLQI